MMRGVAIAPRLIGMTAVTELDFGLLRHALSLLWPSDRARLKIVASATI
jgi:hypothetical protein